MTSLACEIEFGVASLMQLRLRLNVAFTTTCVPLDQSFMFEVIAV